MTPFITGNRCNYCGIGLPGDEGDVNLACDACLVLERPWSYGRAALLYEGQARDLILQFKHGDRTDIARPAAGWMLRAYGREITDKTVILPMPLHWQRLWQRRYNQAAMLGREIARLSAGRFYPDLIKRHRRTQPLKGLSFEARFAELHDAFEVARADQTNLNGCDILIVDDVMTSGASLAALAEFCKASGAEDVTVLVLARAAHNTEILSKSHDMHMVAHA